MPTKKQLKFMDAVADAARTVKLPVARGRPTPENLTQEGRRLGLMAAQAAPRCQAKRRDGQPCRAAALKGARRCIKHGGRVEVPDHPHNIRRFMTGEMHRAMQRHEEYLENRKARSELSREDQRAILDALPKRLQNDERIVAKATEAYLRSRIEGQFRIWQRFVRELAGNQPG